MTEEQRRPDEQDTEQDRLASDEGVDQSVASTPQQAPAHEDPHSAEEDDPTHGQLGHFGRDYLIPGVESNDPDPYRWHTGEKRDHGGEDAIEIIDVVKQFGRMRILNGVNLGLPDNQISMVLGPSGTGKSVLIKHIVGLLYPDSGDVLVHGESVPSMTDDELFEVRKKFGLLFQDGALFGFARWASPRRWTRCRTSSRAGCASGPASRARSSSIPRSSCSTSPTRGSTPCARRCCAS
jgi:phospholipid/cholesterol/gamma-HCH transport system ATP-binding protein